MQIDKAHVNVRVEAGSYVHAQVLIPRFIPLRATTVIFSHGFNASGTEGGQRFVHVAHSLLTYGYHCILFDYRGWGYSDLQTEEMTFATEQADMNAVIDFERRTFPEHRVVILGNSLGSAVASHVASQRTDVSLLVLWCLSANLYERYVTRLGPKITSTGFTYYNEHKIGAQFLQSLKGLDTFAAIRDAKIPCLLVHGDADTTASVELSRTAHRVASDHTTLVEIAGAGHSFSLPPESLDRATEVTLRWLNERTDLDDARQPRG
jgi:pimeloyl-ACP methyl ester carboxylesterase